jgi:chromosome partitioning protein
MLSQLEDELGDAWFRALDGNARSFRVVSAFWRLIQRVAARTGAEVCLVDVGPNLGAINRAALIAADHIVVPLAPDLFSLQGLENLGPTLRSWRAGWQTRLPRKPPGLEIPEGLLLPAGYVVLQHSVRLDRPVRAYEKWISRIPIVYAEAVLDQPVAATSIAEDPNCLGMLKHYRSLVPMAQEAGKPMFFLKPADGAIGSHLDAVHRVYQDFEVLARAIAGRIGLALPAALPGVPE